MKRRATLTSVAILFAASGWGQVSQPPTSEPDPHENPVIQNSPDGKKTSPDDAVSPVPPPKSNKPNKDSKDAPPKPVTPPAPALESEDAIVGTWELVPERSHFNPGPAPKSEVRTYVKTPEGIEATVTTTDANGAVRSISYRWSLDGKDHPVTGSKLLDSIRLERVDNLTAEASLKHGEKVIASERRAFTADGQTMEIVMKDLSSAERPITATLVYTRH